MVLLVCIKLIWEKLMLFLWGIMPPLIMYLSFVSPTTPLTGKGWDYRGNWPYLIMKFCPYSGEFDFYIFSYIIYFFHLKIEQLQTYSFYRFNTKTHNMIYSTYWACIQFNYRCYTTDQNPDIILGDRWGFGGDLLWKASPEVGNWTVVQGQIPYYPHVFHTRISGAYNW